MAQSQFPAHTLPATSTRQNFAVTEEHVNLCFVLNMHRDELQISVYPSCCALHLPILGLASFGKADRVLSVESETRVICTRVNDGIAE